MNGRIGNTVAIERLIRLGVMQRQGSGPKSTIEFTFLFKKFAYEFSMSQRGLGDSDELIAKYGPQDEKILVALDILVNFCGHSLDMENHDVIDMADRMVFLLNTILSNVDREARIKNKSAPHTFTLTEN